MRAWRLDVRPRRGLQHDVHLREARRRRQRHVPLRLRQRDERDVRELLAQRGAELAVGAGEEYAAAQLHAFSHTGARCLSGSHHARLAAYQSAVARRPSSNETCGSQPSSRRSFEESSR
jgi:hypothetical protein